VTKTQVESAVQVLWADLFSALSEELVGLPWQVIQTNVTEIKVMRAGSLDPELIVTVGQESNGLVAHYENSHGQEQSFEITFLENGDSANFKSSANRLLLPTAVAQELLKPLLK
jgi:hypothetical protein